MKITIEANSMEELRAIFADMFGESLPKESKQDKGEKPVYGEKGEKELDYNRQFGTLAIGNVAARLYDGKSREEIAEICLQAGMRLGELVKSKTKGESETCDESETVATVPFDGNPFE